MPTILKMMKVFLYKHKNRFLNLFLIVFLLIVFISFFVYLRHKNIDRNNLHEINKSVKMQMQNISNNNIANSTSSIYKENINKKENNAEVLRVIDGDTIVVKKDNIEMKIRIIGINTPEIVDPRRPVQCFGKEASNKLKNYLKKSDNVDIYVDKTQTNKDKNGRYLRYVYKDGIDIGAMMIQEGFAYQYLYKYEYEKHKEYVYLENEAKRQKRGLWAMCK